MGAPLRTCSCGMALTSITSLVKDGWCWWYREYAPQDTEFDKLENARDAKKGSWAESQTRTSTRSVLHCAIGCSIEEHTSARGILGPGRT